MASDVRRTMPNWYRRRSPGERAAILGGAFTILAAIVGLAPQLMPALQPICDLRIDDTSVVEDGGIATLDIKVRNTGQAVCFVTNADVRVKSILTFRLPPVEALEVPVSADYQVDMPGNGAPFNRSTSVSQAIRENDVDRFRLTFGCGQCGRDPRVYIISVGLQYDSRQSTVETGQILLYMPPSSRLESFFDPQTKRIGANGLSFRRLAEANEESLMRLRLLQGMPSPHVTHLLARAARPINLYGDELESFRDCEDNLALAVSTAKRSPGALPPLAQFISFAAPLEYLDNAISSCRGRENEDDVLYVAATYELIHGRGTDMAIKRYREVADRFPSGQHAQAAGTFATALVECGGDRDGLLALREALMLEAREPGDESRQRWELATKASCPGLRSIAERKLSDPGVSFR